MAIVLLVAPIPAMACGDGGPDELRLLPIAPVEALMGKEPGTGALGLHALVLPDGSAVILRPLSRDEYNAFQIRAVDYEIIEREMLASCIVFPRVTPEEAAAISPELLLLLKRAINRLSGFPVFPGALPYP